MANQDPTILNIGYGKRGAPYFCDSPKSMVCESDGFGSFHFNLASKLGASTDTFNLQSREETKLEPLEFRSISRIVEDHNARVSANRDVTVLVT